MKLPATLIAWMMVIGSGVVAAQPVKPAEAPRPQATFDAASIRRQAGGLAEFRAMLADPDSNVRLLAMREAIRVGDASQRQMAIEAGLASNESSMVEVALRGILTNVQQIVIEATDAEGKITIDGKSPALKLSVVQFDSETGKASGVSSCNANTGLDGKWSGQFQGSVFSFDTLSHYCSGTLIWSGDTADFRGRVNMDSKSPRLSVWKPR